MGLAMLAGTVAIYALGVGWLGALIGYEKASSSASCPSSPATLPSWCWLPLSSPPRGRG
jgi:biotin transporter BioY